MTASRSLRSSFVSILILISALSFSGCGTNPPSPPPVTSTPTPTATPTPTPTPTPTATPTPPPSGAYRLTLSTDDLRVQQGSAAPIDVTVVPSGGFSGPVSVSCSTISGVTISVLPNTTQVPVSIDSGHSARLWVWVGAAPGVSDFTAQVDCTGEADVPGTTASFELTVKEDPGVTPTAMDLPIVTITTQDGAPILDTENYVTGTISIDPNGGEDDAYTGAIQIRGRGNSTFAMSKKPFKVKLSAKVSLLGMPKDKEWALLANYADRTLMRNMVAFELSRRFELPYTPRSRPVEVFLNGDYIGEYQLTETIKISSSRVNIQGMDTDDIADPDVTGGYLLEVDDRRDGLTVETPRHLPIVIHDPDRDPDPQVPEQLNYITDYLTDTENAIFAPQFSDPDLGYANYLDVDSFINWYLVNELFSNNDSVFVSSCWMYKDRGKKLFMGPVWDFDLGAGNVDYQPGAEDPEADWWTRQGFWMHRMFDDPAFAARVRDRWNALKSSEIDTIFDYIDQSAVTLNQAQQNNFQRWLILDRYIWPHMPADPPTYQGEVDQFKSWLHRRVDWMDAQFNPPSTPAAAKQ